jgi:tetratricopeptide (TPR) repeat protein
MAESPMERLAALEERLERDSEDAAAWSARGLCLEALGHLEEALVSFERAAELSPNGPDLYNAGNMLLKLARPQEALLAFERSLELEEGYAPAWVNRGIALYHLVRFYDAQLSFERAQQLDETLIEAWRCRAVLRMDQDDLDGAEADYRKIAELLPERVDAWLELGWCLSRLPSDGHIEQEPGGRERRAIEAVDRAIELEPGRPDGWVGKGEVLLRLLHAAQSTERAFAAARVPSPVSFSAAFREMAEHIGQACERFPDHDGLLDLKMQAMELADQSI